jgi:hypothetical protein
MATCDLSFLEVQWVAKPHKHTATGYKAKNAYGHSPVFGAESCALILLILLVILLLSWEDQAGCFLGRCCQGQMRILPPPDSLVLLCMHGFW